MQYVMESGLVQNSLKRVHEIELCQHTLFVHVKHAAILNFVLLYV